MVGFRKKKTFHERGMVIYWNNTWLTYVPVKSKLQHPPRPPAGQPSGHLNFWKIIVQIPPSAGRKAVQMPPPSCAFGVGARAYFPNSGWWSSLKNYCLYCKDSFNIYILTGNRFQTPSNTEQSLCRPLVFNQSATNMHFFLLNSSKLVSAYVESVQLVTWHRGYWSNSPPPVSGDQMPSLLGRKRHPMPGVRRGGGGGGCWSFDLTGTLF